MKPNVKDGYLFAKEIRIRMNKLDIRMNKPVYPGQAVSDLSKTLMFKFYYDYMQAKYGSKVK